jgi:hypothetical protein
VKERFPIVPASALPATLGILERTARNRLQSAALRAEVDSAPHTCRSAGVLGEPNTRVIGTFSPRFGGALADRTASAPAMVSWSVGLASPTTRDGPCAAVRAASNPMVVSVSLFAAQVAPVRRHWGSGSEDWRRSAMPACSVLGRWCRWSSILDLPTSTGASQVGPRRLSGAEDRLRVWREELDRCRPPVAAGAGLAG